MKQRQRFEPWRQLLFSALLLLAMGMVVTACSSEENDEEITTFVNMPASNKKVPVQLVGENNLPNWLIEIVKQYPYRDIVITKVYIFSGVWKEKNIYLVYNHLMSSFYYNLFDASGTRLEYGDNMEVMAKSHSWKCIYIR